MTDVFLQGLIASTIAGLITGFGGFMIFLKKKYSKENINIMLNIAAGIMLAASFFITLSGNGKNYDFHSDVHVAGFLVDWSDFFRCGSHLGFGWPLLPHEHNVVGHHGPSLNLRGALVVYHCDFQFINFRKAWLWVWLIVVSSWLIRKV